jgi:hypothetical protein
VASAATGGGPDEHESVEDVTAVAEPATTDTAEPDEPVLHEAESAEPTAADGGVASNVAGDSVQAETVSDDSGPDGSDSDGSDSDGSDSDGSASDGSEPDGSDADGPESSDSVSDGSVPDGSVPDGSVPDGSVPDEQASGEDAAESEAVDDTADGAEPTSDVAASEATPTASDARPRRPFLRRGLLALAAAGFVALGVGAFAWVAPSPAAADQRFVETARSQGHDVAAGGQQSLVVSAARKICDRRIIHDTDRERRATALTIDEISAVGAAFGTDTRDFTTLALETYCSS